MVILFEHYERGFTAPFRMRRSQYRGGEKKIGGGMGHGGTGDEKVHLGNIVFGT